MICGYYLSRFDPASYVMLGHATQVATHNAIATSLGVRPKSVQNWRDEFDPIHSNSRKGWKNRPMNPSRLRVAQVFDHLGESELREIVWKILASPESDASQAIVKIVEVQEDSVEALVAAEYVPRGVTGALAEDAFIAFHANTGQPVEGELVDCRQLGCGFDFRIDLRNLQLGIEVKGVLNASSGVLFTNKEWRVANDMGERYFLAVCNVGDAPDVRLFCNPAARMRPRQQVYTVAQISWALSASELRRHSA
jgi:hypothetical protein